VQINAHCRCDSHCKAEGHVEVVGIPVFQVGVSKPAIALTGSLY
jgi:hypothetical protein